MMLGFRFGSEALAAAIAILFLTVKTRLGSFSHSEQWWYGRAFVILAFGPATYVVLDFVIG